LLFGHVISPFPAYLASFTCSNFSLSSCEPASREMAQADVVASISMTDGDLLRGAFRAAR